MERVWIGVLIGLGALILTALLRWLVNRLFRLDWPPRYEWQRARRKLRCMDRWRVIWATHRNHRTGPALAPAQLAYVRYQQEAAQRDVSRRPLWILIAAIYALNSAYWAVAAAHHQHRTTDSLLAAGFAVSALGMGTLARVAGRLTERMAQLAADIKREAEMRRASLR